MIERQARKILPQLGSVKSTWMGRRPTLPDALPIIGRSSKNKNILYAFGHQHIGWTLAGVTGKAINEIISGSQPNFYISTISHQRYSKKSSKLMSKIFSCTIKVYNTITKFMPIN